MYLYVLYFAPENEIIFLSFRRFTYTQVHAGLDGRKSYFAMCACTAADAKFRELRFTKPSGQGQNACSAWALSDDLKFQADERRCTYTSRVAVRCACTQFEVDWSDVRPRVDYVDEISLVQRGRVRPEPHIHKSIRIFIPLWPTMTTTTATTSAATVVKR